MPGMLMSDRINIRAAPRDRLYLLQSIRGRRGKVHDEASRTQVTPELLAEHAFDIGLIVDDKN